MGSSPSKPTNKLGKSKKNVVRVRRFSTIEETVAAKAPSSEESSFENNIFSQESRGLAQNSSSGHSVRSIDSVTEPDAGEFSENEFLHVHGSRMKNSTPNAVLMQQNPKVILAQRSRSQPEGRESLRRVNNRSSDYNELHSFVHENLRTTSGVKGLQNLGNTCFMNSALQCLSNTIPLTDYFIGFDFKSEINKENILGTGGSLAAAYSQIIDQMWWVETERSVVIPRQFKLAISKFAPQFEGYHQHDSLELLSFLLDGIHEDLNRVTEKPFVEDPEGDGSNDSDIALKAWRGYLLRNRSIIVDLFQGQLRSTLTCKKNGKGCGHKSIKFEPFMYLTLPISDETKTIDDCMDLFVCEEELSGSDKWYCPKCKTHVNATKKLDLWMLPPILIVNLKRFEFTKKGKRMKILKPIGYDLAQWKLSTFVRGNQTSSQVYDLYATINHYGDKNHGHYTAYACNRMDDKWYEFNDSRCSMMEDDDLSEVEDNMSAYVLFYNRVEDSSHSGESCRSNYSSTIRRQSLGRPHLWPHNVTTRIPDEESKNISNNRENFKNFTRTKSNDSNSSLASSHNQSLGQQHSLRSLLCSVNEET